MSTASEQHALTQAAPRPPIIGVPLDSRLVQEQEGSTVDLRNYLHTLYDNRWLIGWITSIITLVAVLYVLIAKPVFEANLMIHVEEESSNASKNILSEASSLFETKKTAIAEIELLRSRTVVSSALDNLQPYVEVQPKYFPIGGFWFAKRNGDALSDPGLFGYGGYVWGGENAEVSLFEIPEAWLGHECTLISLGNQRFRFIGADQRVAFEGEVGLRYRLSIPEGVINLKVERIAAKSGAHFILRRLSRLAVTESIQDALMIAEQGKQSGIIEVKLHGENALRTYSMLNEIGQEYMRQNLARKTEEAEKSLAFLNRQLPILKRQIEQAEDRYNQFRNTHDAVDLQDEARTSLAQLAAARARRIDLIRRKAELLVRFTENHPIMAAVNHERKEVDGEIAAINARIKAIPSLEQDEARLMRDIKVNTDHYTALSNSAQQLRLTSVGRVSNVRMVDAPIPPEEPVKPNRPLVVTLAAVTGLFVGVIAAFTRQALVGGINDPLKIDQMLRTRVVYATIPHSSNQDKLMRKANDHGSALPLLTMIMPDDPAVESLRSFRAALQFSMPHFGNNVVMFTGPVHGIGKSFVTANFAAVMAASGKRVLLIDTDVRTGQMYRYFGVRREYGLSNAVVGKATIGEVLHDNVLDNLDFIASGDLLPDGSEFLLDPTFGNLLKQTGAHYDVVLLNSPPVLSGADALTIGAHAGAVFMVARAGRTNEGQINESINRLNRAGISLQGVLFNDMIPRLSTYGPYESKKRIDSRALL